MRRLLLASVALTALLAPRFAHAQVSEQEVRRALMAYERSPDASQWRALGEGAVAPLIAVYRDASAPPFVRLRAVSAIAAFHTSEVHSFLRSVVADRSASDLLVGEALGALGRAFGAAAVPDLVAGLRDPRTAVREAAAHALGRIATPRARSAMRARLRVEHDESVRAALSVR